ncbi:hybrid signal transduction histidine kinase M-like protein [Parasponia andersonii]|uniref:Hybrid signal transduction histidine kinase M-like protein n=1 Tax=Parasponia andersonii TaxID=3476 RepID=A0A2P5DII4_PARAD|nr:hybrid signal transduction histidine kinase M-like protein [Parasponia andersonii]
MSIAFESNRRIDIEPSGFTRAGVAPCSLLFDSPEQEGRATAIAAAAADDDDAVKDSNAFSASTSNSCSASSSPSSSSLSSIGKNSDLSERSCSDGEDSEENEAQSSYKGPLEMMDALEEVLPIRRGISSFYNGKSKSFTSLGDAVSASSIKDIAKPENAYSRKRRNLLAFNHVWEKNRSFPLRSNGSGISKRPISSSRSTLALAVAMSSSESSNSTSDESFSRSPPPLPPLHPQARNTTKAPPSSSSSSPTQRNFSSLRSFSLADLRH